MSKYTKTALVLCVSAAFCWFVLIVLNPSNLEFILALAAIALTIAAVCSLAVSIGRKLCKQASPYLIFAVTDILIGICVVAYAVYDIKTSTGWFAGLLGTLLLIFVLPIVLIFLLADVLVRRLKKTKK